LQPALFYWNAPPHTNAADEKRSPWTVIWYRARTLAKSIDNFCWMVKMIRAGRREHTNLFILWCRVEHWWPLPFASAAIVDKWWLRGRFVVRRSCYGIFTATEMGAQPCQQLRFSLTVETD
jgi:hypothetical protein